MKQHVFRLERVARVRRIQRDAARGKWAMAKAAENAAQAQLDAARDAAQADRVGFTELHTPTDLSTAAFRATARTNAITVASEDLRVAQNHVQLTAEALQTTQRRVDTLDRLNTREKDRWNIEYRRWEMAETDDIVTGRAGRRGMSNLAKRYGEEAEADSPTDAPPSTSSPSPPKLRAPITSEETLL